MLRSWVVPIVFIVVVRPYTYDMWCVGGTAVTCVVLFLKSGVMKTARITITAGATTVKQLQYAI